MPSLGTDQRGEGIEFLDEIERALDVVEGLAPRPEDEGVAVLESAGLRVARRQVEDAVNDEHVGNAIARGDLHELVGNPGGIAHAAPGAPDQGVGAVLAVQGTAALGLQRLDAVLGVVPPWQHTPAGAGQVFEVERLARAAGPQQRAVHPVLQALDVFERPDRSLEFLE
jgi:hypothetical protein